MKKIIFFLFLIITNLIIAQTVVINEIMYDPDGVDTGNEWIELYNNSNDVIYLNSWKIEKAGGEFETIFAFDGPDTYQILPHSYFLVGEEFVPNTDLIETLVFQNGGTATDGIRIVSPDGFYTDTALYDSPNSNDLPDDLDNPAINFAPDVSSGNSLARKQDGVDSNNCEIDFFECENPTPNEANLYPIDLAIYSMNIVLENDVYWLETTIWNLSTENVDNLTATLEIHLNDHKTNTYQLPPIMAEDSVFVNYQISKIEDGYNSITTIVNYPFDNYLENNIVSKSILLGDSPIIINEVMFKPLESNQEWVEVFNRTDCVYRVDNFQVIDTAGGIISICDTIQLIDFLVICEDKNKLLISYPSVASGKVIEAEHWTSLNNIEESLNLIDYFGTKLDSVFYSGDNCEENISIERVNPYLSSFEENWGSSVSNLGATPCEKNSIFVEILPPSSKLSVSPNPFSSQNGIPTVISFKLPEIISTVTIRIFDLKGQLVKTILNQTLQACEGNIIWNGSNNDGFNLPIGVYIILMEATALNTEKIYSNKISVVIGN